MKFLIDEEMKTILLDVGKSLFDFDKLGNFAREKGLFEKPDLHITIVGRKTGEKINAFPEKEILWDKIKVLVKSFAWKFSIGLEIYYPSKTCENNEIREALVQIVNLPDMKLFYKKLNELVSAGFRIPFSHVTLYSDSSFEEKKFRGIGLYSKEQFEELKPLKVIL